MFLLETIANFCQTLNYMLLILILSKIYFSKNKILNINKEKSNLV